MRFFRRLENLIFGKKASEINKLLREKRDEAESLISRIEEEKMLLQAGHSSKANNEKKAAKAESNRLPATKF